jgi:hypothetical protein
MASPKKPDVCQDCGGKRGNGKKFCKSCSAKRDYYRTTISNKKRTKEHHEKSTFLESRTVKAKCPKCERLHKVKVKVMKHVVITRPIKKACPEREFWFTKSDYGETYSLSGLGRSRD